MWWINVIIVLFLLQSLFLNGIDGNANRRHRRRRQTSGSLYGTNANLGASAPAGYNYPANTNIQGIKLNNPDARDLYGSNQFPTFNAQGPLTSVNFYDQPRLPQQQVYGTGDQVSSSGYYGAGSFYSGSGTNQLSRDPNGNLLPSGSSFYSSSNTQLAYPPNTNQVLANRDLFGQQSNPNTNNQYPYGSNQQPNSNTYGASSGTNSFYSGSMGSNSNLPPNTNNAYGGSFGSNSNLPPNTNIYRESMGSNSNLPPNTNIYSGSMGGNPSLGPSGNSYPGYMGSGSNANSWLNQNQNQNSYYRYNQNPGNSLYPNRDTNSNPNTNNRYANVNPFNPNNSYRLSTSISVIFLSIFASIVLHF